MSDISQDANTDVASLLSDTHIPDDMPPSDATSNSGSSSGVGPDSAIHDLRQEIAQLRDQLARAQADYNNLVRRNREESMQIGQWSEDKTILKFLPVLDDLERSLEHIPAELQNTPWIEGQVSIVRRMQKVIVDFGMTKMDTLGQELDPDLHEVISQIPHETSMIQANIESGYMRGGRVIRHAKVVVGDGSKSI